MALFHLIVLALIQGVTEFLPISSSAHLILAPQAAGAADQGPLIDAMAHLGSLLAVIVYFRKEVGAVIIGGAGLLTGRMSPGGRLALLIAAAIPVVVFIGAALYATGWIDRLRDPRIIAAATIGFALPLWLADRYGASRLAAATLSWRQAALIGASQAFAFIPGASRSGVTMTVGRALGLSRPEAARFSMLISIPVIGAIGATSILELARGADPGAQLSDGLIVAVFSFLAAWASIAVLMRVVAKIGFLPFVLYRLALGGAIVLALSLGWLSV